MDQSLEREIRRLYSCFHSARDPDGRSFVPLADAYRRAGDLQRARLLLEEGLRRHPRFASAHVVAMRIARDVSDHAGALSATRRVLELDPGNVEARRALADVGPLVEEARPPAASGFPGEGDAGLPDESWMVGDAGAWGGGTDSGLASVDPEALEAEEQQAARRAVEARKAVREVEEREATREVQGLEAEREAEGGGIAGEAGEPGGAGDAREQAGAREPEEEAATREPAEDAVPAGTETRVNTPTAPRETGSSPRAIPAASSSGVARGAADAGIYTRTMGRLYEQQGLHVQAVAVYERLLESEPGDDALAQRLARLRRQARDEASGLAEPEPGRQDVRSGPAGGKESGEAKPSGGALSREGPDAVPDPGGRVVPIEALAPDAPVAEAQGRAP